MLIAKNSIQKSLYVVYYYQDGTFKIKWKVNGKLATKGYVTQSGKAWSLDPRYNNSPVMKIVQEDANALMSTGNMNPV